MSKIVKVINIVNMLDTEDYGTLITINIQYTDKHVEELTLSFDNESRVSLQSFLDSLE